MSHKLSFWVQVLPWALRNPSIRGYEVKIHVRELEGYLIDDPETGDYFIEDISAN